MPRTYERESAALTKFSTEEEAMVSRGVPQEAIAYLIYDASGNGLLLFDLLVAIDTACNKHLSLVQGFDENYSFCTVDTRDPARILNLAPRMFGEQSHINAFKKYLSKTVNGVESPPVESWMDRTRAKYINL